MSIISFSRKRRLRESYLFLDVGRSGAKGRGVYFSLSWKADPAETGVRCGIVISRKVAPRAVDRNKFRRLLKESLRRNEDMFPDPKKGLAVIVVRQLLQPLKLALVEKELQKCLQKLKT